MLICQAVRVALDSFGTWCRCSTGEARVHVLAAEEVGGEGSKVARLRGGGGRETRTEVDEEKACTGREGAVRVVRVCEFGRSTTGVMQSGRLLLLRGPNLSCKRCKIHVQGIHSDSSKMLLYLHPFPM